MKLDDLHTGQIVFVHIVQSYGRYAFLGGCVPVTVLTIPEYAPLAYNNGVSVTPDAQAGANYGESANIPPERLLERPCEQCTQAWRAWRRAYQDVEV